MVAKDKNATPHAPNAILKTSLEGWMATRNPPILAQEALVSLSGT